MQSLCTLSVSFTIKCFTPKINRIKLQTCLVPLIVPILLTRGQPRRKPLRAAGPPVQREPHDYEYVCSVVELNIVESDRQILQKARTRASMYVESNMNSLFQYGFWVLCMTLVCSVCTARPPFINVSFKNGSVAHT